MCNITCNIHETYAEITNVISIDVSIRITYIILCLRQCYSMYSATWIECFTEPDNLLSIDINLNNVRAIPVVCKIYVALFDIYKQR